jgi:hypothetical protein
MCSTAQAAQLFLYAFNYFEYFSLETTTHKTRFLAISCVWHIRHRSLTLLLDYHVSLVRLQIKKKVGCVMGRRKMKIFQKLDATTHRSAVVCPYFYTTHTHHFTGQPVLFQQHLDDVVIRSEKWISLNVK